MRTFRATVLQDNTLPWQLWDDSAQTRKCDVEWGVSLVPTPIYASYDDNGIGQGDILYYEWTALLDPEIALPDWITEVNS